jgi:hypothetical protein
MARKKRDGNGESRSEPLLAVVQTDVSAAGMHEVTNINATIFCPHILHKKDYMPRSCSTCLPYPNDKYHWWQRKDFINVQFCKLKRNADEDFEKCWKRFNKCDDYLDVANGSNGIQGNPKVHVGKSEEEAD